MTKLVIWVVFWWKSYQISIKLIFFNKKHSFLLLSTVLENILGCTPPVKLLTTDAWKVDWQVGGLTLYHYPHYHRRYRQCRLCHFAKECYRSLVTAEMCSWIKMTPYNINALHFLPVGFCSRSCKEMIVTFAICEV